MSAEDAGPRELAYERLLAFKQAAKVGDLSDYGPLADALSAILGRLCFTAPHDVVAALDAELAWQAPRPVSWQDVQVFPALRQQ